MLQKQKLTNYKKTNEDSAQSKSLHTKSQGRDKVRKKLPKTYSTNYRVHSKHIQ